LLTPAALPNWGSSPRVRGRPTVQHLVELAAGLIPACAGQTLGCTCTRLGTRAHPRVCGADGGPATPGGGQPGSSPRVRGRPPPPRRGTPSPRLIPACAGQTGTPLTEAEGGKGSSPRVRGRRAVRRSDSLGLGLIPACAGQTPAGSPSWLTRRAHPRVCGADSQPLRHRRFRLGLIPACAGQTFSHGGVSSSGGAHPRVCGADFFGNTTSGSSRGSSPRVRGRHSNMRPLEQPLRLIPACAGQTP